MLIGGSLLGLWVGIWLFGSVWPVDDDTETAYIYAGTGGLVSGLLGASAIAGSLIMAPNRVARWLSPLAGALFAVGFIGLSFANLGSDSAPWLLIGIVGIAACVIWFYVLGVLTIAAWVGIFLGGLVLRRRAANKK